MSRWIALGLLTGRKTSRFPDAPDLEAEAPTTVTVITSALTPELAIQGAEACPTGALVATGDGEEGGLEVDLGQCILCAGCIRAAPEAFRWGAEAETAVRRRERLRASIAWRRGRMVVAPTASTPNGGGEAVGEGRCPDDRLRRAADELHRRSRRLFGRSLHIRHIDVGSCDGCESELQLLASPSYDLSRLGLFFTPSPRHADALLVTGVVTRQMEQPLLETYRALPEPKLVVAAGVCALGGGSFAGGLATRGPLDHLLPVDVYVPGCPPPPLTLLHGLLLAVGRAEERLHILEER